MTLTADGVIFHKIFAIDDIERVLGRFGPWEVPNLPIIIPISAVAQILWKIRPSIVKVISVR